MPDDPKETNDQKPTEPTETEGTPDVTEAKVEPEEDALSPEAIAKRVAALGGEDELERVARQEEERLQARRKEQKRGKKGLEASASKRLAKIGEGKVKRPVSTAVPADEDPLMARTAHLTKWVKENAKVVQWAAVAAIVGLGGFFGWQYYQDRKEGAASLALTQAVADERGRIGDPDKEEEGEAAKFKDPRPLFKTPEARRDAALAKYREVVAKYPGTGAAILARLGEGSLLLDKHDSDGAIAAFESVKGSPLAAADAEVKGRALEGIGFAYELKSIAGDKDKNLDLALKAFKDLEQVDAKGFKELGLYHQARCFEARGDKVKAIELLKDVYGRVSKAEDHPFSYLQFVVEDRLRALDPAALPAKSMPAGGMGGLNGLMGENGQIDMSDPRVKKILEEMMRQKGPGGGGPVQK